MANPTDSAQDQEELKKQEELRMQKEIELALFIQTTFNDIEPKIANAVASKYATPSDNDPDSAQEAAELCVKALNDIATIAAQENGSDGKVIEIVTPKVDSNFVEIWVTFPALGDYKDQPLSKGSFNYSGPLTLIAGDLEKAMGNTLPNLQSQPKAMAFGYAIRIRFTFIKAKQQ